MEEKNLSKNIIKTFSDPVVWCQSYLKDPRDKTKPLILRSYQSLPLSVSRTNKNIVLRYGRRCGKSVTMCADCLWWALAYPLVRMIETKATVQLPFRVIVVGPYENQIDELWKTFGQLIADSELLNSQIKKMRSTDYLIEFENGSIITGHTVGISSSNQGTSLRGISADLIFADEMDYIPREIFEQVIIPISTTNSECRMRFCSTPKGTRDLFYELCTKAEELGWWTNHVPSWHPDNDNWLSIEQAKAQGRPITDSAEYQVKAITDSATYEREYGAEFGEEFGGVYKHHLLERALVKYNRLEQNDPDIFDPGFEQNPQHKYVMGVDWNSYTNGGQIVVVEFCSTPTIETYFDDENKQDVTVDFTGKYRLFYRRGIKVKSATQRLTRNEIIRLLTYFKIDFIYVDYGAGDTNIEELTLYGTQHPELELNKKLKVVDSGAVVDHWDPIIQRHVKKRNKSMMINFSVINLEEGTFLLPKEEDTKARLIGQMREYRIKNVTSRGEYAYEGEDHILDAFNLAIYGFEQNWGSLLRQNVKYSIIPVGDPRVSIYPRRVEVSQSPGYVNYAGKNLMDPEKLQNRINGPRKAWVPKIGNTRPNINFRRSSQNGLANFARNRGGF